MDEGASSGNRGNIGGRGACQYSRRAVIGASAGATDGSAEPPRMAASAEIRRVALPSGEPAALIEVTVVDRGRSRIGLRAEASWNDVSDDVVDQGRTRAAVATL